MTDGIIALRAAGTALVLDVPASGTPRVLHWGADLGEVDAELGAALRTGVEQPAPPSSVDFPRWFPLLAGEADGWSGRPALAGHREGAVSHPRWTVHEVDLDHPSDRHPASGSGGELTVRASDERSGLAVTVTLRMEAGGLVRTRHRVTNTGTGAWTVGGLVSALPLPDEATELLDLTGRWCRERSPQRRPLVEGSWARESRRGRTGHDAPLLLVAGQTGFGFRHGEVWGVHVAWSGDQVHLAERLPERAGQASATLGGGELLRPGEVRLAPGETHTTPWVCFSWSDRGLDGLSARLHDWLRSRRHHPRTPRPLVLNTWEAVYFDHDVDTLRELASVAASVGVERFVLDDGWFLGRRHERAGLGDWHVDPGKYPDGLHPVFDHVRELGMEVGLWVEPEMVNPDSDLYRAHPDWVLAAEGRLPLPWRHQHVLDLSRPEVADHLFERLTALVTEYRIDYLKWDHNRDLLEAVHGPTGRAGVHGQTLGVYRLLDRLRERHPRLEIESCSSGGARVDLGVLERTDRVWASDTNDPVERQVIQRWTEVLLPPELVGSHVGGPTSHTTGRVTDLRFRLLTSLGAHAGIEWNLVGRDEAELDAIRAWAALYRELRGLLHGGRVVHVDHPDPEALVRGVVAPDGREAVFSYARLGTSTGAVPGRVRLPGLNPDHRYLVRLRTEVGEPTSGSAVALPRWIEEGGVVFTGRALDAVGLQLPVLHPAHGLLLHLRAA
ncbi:alpha-galactosidase [Actinoalloteichus caeruleus]|uniref:alpha-galactosidase n=1 Tax=Actinoalloteichus cyanogriseus TaxID=2893586 RepID=UPI0004A9F22C|nr:alpha-galactosidase [Actinoalloteichus caeruleus]